MAVALVDDVGIIVVVGVGALVVVTGCCRSALRSISGAGEDGGEEERAGELDSRASALGHGCGSCGETTTEMTKVEWRRTTTTTKNCAHPDILVDRMANGCV